MHSTKMIPKKWDYDNWPERDLAYWPSDGDGGSVWPQAVDPELKGVEIECLECPSLFRDHAKAHCKMCDGFGYVFEVHMWGWK